MMGIATLHEHNIVWVIYIARVEIIAGLECMHTSESKKVDPKQIVIYSNYIHILYVFVCMCVCVCVCIITIYYYIHVLSHQTH